MTVVLKLIPVALRDFALPVPRTGGIEAHSGYGRAAEEGREIHIRVQKKRAKSDPSYESEVRVSRSFDREGYRFRIDGRMDGIFRREPPWIEEIKTGFNVRELGRLLSENPLAHPYGLQLAAYGYFHWPEHKVVPGLFVRLVSTRGREGTGGGTRAARPRQLAAELSLPFATPRPGQVELMHAVEQAMSEGRP